MFTRTDRTNGVFSYLVTIEVFIIVRDGEVNSIAECCIVRGSSKNGSNPIETCLKVSKPGSLHVLFTLLTKDTMPLL